MLVDGDLLFQLLILSVEHGLVLSDCISLIGEGGQLLLFHINLLTECFELKMSVLDSHLLLKNQIYISTNVALLWLYVRSALPVIGLCESVRTPQTICDMTDSSFL